MADIKVVEEKNTVKVNPRDTNVIAIQEIRNYVEVSASGPQGIQGPQGPQGEPGVTVIPVAGAQGQVLVKASATNYDTAWANTVSSVIGGTGLTGGTITTTGTLAVDANVIPYLTASQTFTGTQTIVTPNVNASGLIIKGVTSQNADTLVIKSSSDSVLMRVDSNGGVFANTVSTLNSYIKIGEENSGGYVQFTKQTSTPTAFGNDKAGIYFRTGNLAGTLRLAISAGVSGDEVTLVDDIPQTSGLATSRLGVSIIEGGSA
jgi:hypothetical protein